ncbi:DUF2397 family protein [Streptomyces achromogenes]|uniref:DUF2397 family protein n=1 Tax=Streptomyces achromogenes TaxID=67255 RepID=UPI0036FC1694
MAFGLHSSRHLTVDADTLAERAAARDPASTLWSEARPLGIIPQSCRTGSYERRGATAPGLRPGRGQAPTRRDRRPAGGGDQGSPGPPHDRLAGAIVPARRTRLARLPVVPVVAR